MIVPVSVSQDFQPQDYADPDDQASPHLWLGINQKTIVLSTG